MEITLTLLDCIRTNVRDPLGVLADPVAQRWFQEDAERTDVARALLDSWIEDAYIPGNLAFDRAFTAEELADLAAFDETLVAAADEIGELPPDVARLQAHPAWKRVQHAAEATLHRLHDKPPPL